MSNFAEAIAHLQEAQQKLVEALNKLDLHNTDPAAHEYLQEMIKKVINSETIYTKSQIEEICRKGIADHTDKEFTEAHPGWEDYEKNTTEAMASLMGRVESLELWRDGGDDGPKSSLEKALQLVEDKYAPILQSLQNAFRDAEEQGNTAVADEIKRSISTTLDQKKAELLKVMEEWQAENSKP